MKGKTAMKTVMQNTGCMVVALMLTASSLLSAPGKSSGDSIKKEKMNMSGWIGVMIQDVTEKSAKKAKLDSEEGAYVSDVVDDSPADSAGLKKGDVIVEFNGKKLIDADDLTKWVHRISPGTRTSLAVIRNGEKKTMNITIGTLKRSRNFTNGRFPPMPYFNNFGGNHILGLQLITLNEQLGEYFSAPNNEGVLVEEVEKESMGEKAGFKAGDVITRVGKRTVGEAEKIQKELQKYDEGDKVEFEVLRKGTKKLLSVEVEEDQSLGRNFYFHGPHIRSFRSKPFNDTDMQLNMDELEPDIDQIQIEIEETMRGSKNGYQENQLQEPSLMPPSRKSVRL
jgi:PDZ domain-containing secreted protein